MKRQQRIKIVGMQEFALARGQRNALPDRKKIHEHAQAQKERLGKGNKETETKDILPGIPRIADREGLLHHTLVQSHQGDGDQEPGAQSNSLA